MLLWNEFSTIDEAWKAFNPPSHHHHLLAYIHIIETLCAEQQQQQEEGLTTNKATRIGSKKPAEIVTVIYLRFYQ